MILILLDGGALGKDHEHDQDHEQEWRELTGHLEPDEFLRILTRQPSVPLAFPK
jgi:hypothetical protein